MPLRRWAEWLLPATSSAWLASSGIRPGARLCPERLRQRRQERMLDSWLQQALQFPVPELEIVLGNYDGRHCGDLLGPENVIEPNKNANVIGGHVQENKKNAILSRKIPVSH